MPRPAGSAHDRSMRTTTKLPRPQVNSESDAPKHRRRALTAGVVIGLLAVGAVSLPSAGAGQPPSGPPTWQDVAVESADLAGR